AKEAQAASIIKLSCSPEVQQIVKGIRNPQEIWNMLETSMNTAGSYIGRQDILCHFRTYRLKENELLKTYFTRLSNYRTQLDNTDDAITDHDFRTQIFTSLPSQHAEIENLFRREEITMSALFGVFP
ncbi:hypothetical protein K440DRAFT_551346, partial [Wilcoxina mikolae CBS 423.85]